MVGCVLLTPSCSWGPSIERDRASNSQASPPETPRSSELPVRHKRSHVAPQVRPRHSPSQVAAPGGPAGRIKHGVGGRSGWVLFFFGEYLEITRALLHRVFWGGGGVEREFGFQGRRTSDSRATQTHTHSLFPRLLESQAGTFLTRPSSVYSNLEEYTTAPPPRKVMYVRLLCRSWSRRRGLCAQE